MNPRISPHPGRPNDRSQDIYFWTVPQSLDFPAIATESSDGTWAFVTTCTGSRSVWTNPGICCHHADPDGGRRKPGSTVNVTNSVRILRGGLKTAADRLRPVVKTE